MALYGPEVPGEVLRLLWASSADRSTPAVTAAATEVAVLPLDERVAAIATLVGWLSVLSDLVGQDHASSGGAVLSMLIDGGMAPI